jgi:superfamily II DNA or RNA helicase
VHCKLTAGLIVISVQVESGVKLFKSELSTYLIKKLTRRFTYRDPLFLLKQRQHLPTDDLTKYLATYTEIDGCLNFYRGSLGTIIRILKEEKLQYEIIDQRLWLPKISMPCRIVLRDYQVPGVKKMIRRQQTIIRAMAASGKTEMLLKVAAYFQQPTLILVWQERQQSTWVKRIPEYFDFWPGGIGGAFTKPCLDSPIVVGMLQTVRNHLADLKYRFGCVICDEVNRVAAPSLRTCVNAFPAAIRLGASDDERRRDGREFLLYDTFGPRGWRLQQQAQCPVDVVLVPTTFKYSQGRIESMTYEWHTVLNEMLADKARNQTIINLAAREVDNGRRVIVFSDRVDHCKYLKDTFVAQGYKAGLLIGTTKMRKEAQATEAGLIDGSVEIGIGTKVAEQSINIPPLDVGIMTCASAGQKMYRFKQMRGRLARTCEGKEKATLYYLYDEKVLKLRKKKYNIKSLFSVKEMILPKGIKMEQQAVTTDTLKAGCKQLGIATPKGATAKKLTKLIERELAKHKTWGSYTCGACFRDIIDRIAVCPFCQAKFTPIPDDDDEEDQYTEEEETEEDEEEPEEEEELEEDDDSEDDEDEDTEEEDDDDTDDDEDLDDDDEEDEDSEEEEDEDLDNDEEEEEEPPKKRGRPKKKATKKEEAPKKRGRPKKEEAPKKKSKSAKVKAKRERADKKADKEQKRAQIKSELPYSTKQLKAMRRTTHIMIASVLGIKNPMKLGTDAELLKAIVKMQKKKFK